MRDAAPFVRRAVSMTPLIDVVFLLLLFFMLTSTFSTFGEIELNQATDGSGAQQDVGDRLFVQLGSDRLTLNGREATLEALLQGVSDEMMLVSLDEDVTAQRLVDFLNVLRGRSDLRVLVLE